MPAASPGASSARTHPDQARRSLPATGLRSCLYQGWVRHRRTHDVDHAFRRNLFLLFLDLDEIPRVLENGWLSSATRAAFARFAREDHTGDPALPLAQSIRQLVQQQTGSAPSGPICLLTQLRYFGYGFNPISLFYCYDETGSRVETIVAEVSNTPWREMHCYVLPVRGVSSAGVLQLDDHAKDFHVSPFMEMDHAYHWRVSEPGDDLLVHLENWQGEKRVFDATMHLAREPWSRAALVRHLLRFPLMSAQIVGSIYFEALRLWWKGARFRPHPAGLEPGAGAQSSARRPL